MLHYIESTGILIHFKHGLNITSDALNLVDFVKRESDDKVGKVLDLGSGIGTLTFLLYKQKNFENFYCVEIQKEIFEILEFNIKSNKLANVYALNYNVKDMLNDKYYEKFDYIVSNPPFYKTNSGFLPKDELIAISKFEIKLTLKEFLNASYHFLKKDGILFFIFPKNRENEILSDKRFSLIKKEDVNYSKKNFVCIN